MSRQIEIGVIVSSYQRPDHLMRTLTSIELQQGVAGMFEVVISDDGSEDETAELVQAFSDRVDFPVTFVTHPHDGFQLARCRNEGAAASNARYVLFVDGDCILPPDHLAEHLKRREPGVVMGGDCIRLEREPSDEVTLETLRQGLFPATPPSEKRRMRRQSRKAWFYNLVRHPTKPKLIGNNIGIWWEDYQRLNGYDQNFVGWGCEDDDLRLRAHRTGLKVKSILRWTYTYHLWHPTEETQPDEWKNGLNVAYLKRPIRLTRCLNGLQRRSSEELVVRLVGTPEHAGAVENVAPQLARSPGGEERTEVEVLFLPGQGSFTGNADCNILVMSGQEDGGSCRSDADMILVASLPITSAKEHPQVFRLDEFKEALARVA
jgi:glycosyltransferase involved in cell wall biosynthesis